MHDDLGKRMKEQYEHRTRFFLPRRTYTIVRLDGKAFHTYTRKCQRPYDTALAVAMDYTACMLCYSIQGAVLAYVQSDEISLLLTDFNTIKTDAWFNGNIQKITSVSASIATAEFNKKRHQQLIEKEITPAQHRGLALFDSRVFTIPDRTEVMNYFIWRQKDASRNSLSMLAQHYYSSAELHGKNQSDMHEMLHKVHVNWDNQPPGFKRGRLVRRYPGPTPINWLVEPPEIWTQSTELQSLIPKYEDAQ